MSYENMLALRNMECEKNHAIRMEVLEKEKRLSDAYANSGMISIMSMLAGGVLYKTGAEVAGMIFIGIAALAVNSMMKKFETWQDFTEKYHV